MNPLSCLVVAAVMTIVSAAFSRAEDKRAESMDREMKREGPEIVVHTRRNVSLYPSLNDREDKQEQHRSPESTPWHRAP